MKVRLAKELQQVGQFLSMFKSSKAKCAAIIHQLNMDVNILSPYLAVEKLFSIDINLLGIHHLTERKEKLIDAIDEMNKLESKLNLQMIRQKQRAEAELEQEAQFCQESFVSVAEPMVQQIHEIQSLRQAQKGTKDPHIYEQRARLPPCQAQFSSKINQLHEVWIRNRPQPNEDLEDKFDRISKVIGILKKGVKSIYKEEKARTSTISLYDYEEFTKITEALDKTVAENDELKSKNHRLIEDNSILKQNTESSKQNARRVEVHRTSREAQTDIQQQGQMQDSSELTLVENQKFRIVKMFKSPFEMDGSDIEQRIFPELSQQSVLKMSTINDSVIQYIPEKQLSIDSEQSQQILPQEMPLGTLSFNKKAAPQDQKIKTSMIDTKELSNVEAKLKQIRQNRKKIINDDDLWSQMENLKI